LHRGEYRIRDSVAYRMPRDPGGSHFRSSRASLLAVVAGFSAALAYAIWLLWPRFAIPSPSAIDDWNGSSHDNRSLGELFAPFFEAPVQRFRPGFDFFDHLQWHTLGAPLDMTGPNAWNVVRVALLVAAIGVVPALLARALRPELSPFALAALAALPPCVVITGTAIPVDLARLAPQEPMLIGASVCGAALVLLGLDRRVAGRSLSAVVVPIALGWPLFAIGATFKEAAIAFLATAPFVYLFLVRRWRERGLVDGLLDPLRRPDFLACAALLLLPLLWEAFRVATIGDQGANLYQAGAPTGTGEWGDRIRAAWDLQWSSMSEAVASPLWKALAIALPVLALAVWLDRGRVPLLALGLGLAALLMLVIQGLPAVVTSRYFLPTMALLAMATTLLLAQGRTWIRWAGLAAALVLVVSGAGAARDSVTAWADGERAGSSFFAQVADLAERGCRLHTWGLDTERGEALPRLLAMQMDGIRRGDCPTDDTLVVTLGVGPPESPRGADVGKACREPWEGRGTLHIWTLMSCAKLARRVDGEPTAALLHRARLIPGVGAMTRADCVARTPKSPACDRPALRRADMWP
jgi:hypothetical protein